MSDKGPTTEASQGGDAAPSPKVFEATIAGETIQWDQGISYGQHLQMDKLLSSQQPVSDKPDEMLFIIIHQTMELWIKLMLHETREAMAALREDHFGLAGKTLERIATIMQHMIQSWEVLATLSPHEFMTFRGFLGKASGFQSVQYRELEYLLGLKRAEFIAVHEADAEATAQLTHALEAPSLYDEVIAVLARAGHPIPNAHLERDFATAYEPEPAVEQAWLDIYADPHNHWELYRLGEKVTAIEYYFQEWRFKHMKTVSRVIGHRQGTGGSAGVSYLIKALDLHFFPELWAMRTQMSPPDASDRT